jgi:hypothetical protein
MMLPTRVTHSSIYNSIKIRRQVKQLQAALQFPEKVPSVSAMIKACPTCTAQKQNQRSSFISPLWAWIEASKALTLSIGEQDGPKTVAISMVLDR